MWRPDRAHPRAQNVDQVVAGLQALAERLGPLLATAERVVVLGGNCTIALAVMARLSGSSAGEPGLLYFDRQYDLNTPESTTDGALDWMGLAHGLALPGCVDAVAGAFGRRPLLHPAQVAWVGVEPSLATQWEREHAVRLGLHVASSDMLAADPAGAARDALAVPPPGRLAVHLDVDVLDFTDAPLAENTDGRNTGPTLDQLGQALGPALGDPRCRVLSIGELNPTRSAGDPDALPRFVRMLASALGTDADRPG